MRIDERVNVSSGFYPLKQPGLSLIPSSALLDSWQSGWYQLSIWENIPGKDRF